jgi:hypothetical protein
MNRSKLSKEQIELFEAYVEMPHLSKVGRIAETFKLGTWKCGISRKIAQVVFT